MMLQRQKNIYHLGQAILANLYYGWPSKKLKVIGVTGTDGKTTTTSLIYHILKSAGKKTSMITTVYAKVGEQEYDTGLHTTTPHSFDIQRFLRKSQEAGDEYFVLETTSHALDQNRIYGVLFYVGLITNITHEHLDYHKTYENYVKAKAKLLLHSQYALINKDDNSYELLEPLLIANNKSFQTYGLEEETDFNQDIEKQINQPLAPFNKYNYLAAYSVCHILGLSDKEIFSAMKTFNLPPGRFEVVYDKDFTVIVDFAHTPNAMAELLKAVSLLYPKRRIINVFGSAARRDVTKRPAMGVASATYSDVTIITEDDPRDEGAENIAKQIALGLEKKEVPYFPPEQVDGKKKAYTIIPDRYTALEKALSLWKKGDVFVFNGKGHEKSIARAHGEDPWSDQEVVKEILTKMKLL